MEDRNIRFPWNGMGLALDKLDRYEESVTAYKKASEIDPGSYGAWTNLGLSYSRANRHNEAINAYTHAIKLQPDSYETITNKALELSMLEKYSEAFTTIEKAIKIKPDYPQAWNTKGEVLTNLGEINEAIKAYNVTIEIISDQEAHEIPRLGKIKYKALNKKGLAFFRIEQFKEAAAEFGKALDIDPNSHATWMNKGLS